MNPLIAENDQKTARAVRWDQAGLVAGICLVLAAITFAVFGQTLHHDFIDFDDNDYVYDNPVVARGLTLKGIAWAFSSHAYNWHPLTWFSRELDCQLYGLNPGGHHLTNVLLHTATAIALFLVLRQMTGALWRCAFVAAVFAIHPLRVESVAWVAERKDVLSGLFFVLTMGAYVRYARHPWSIARYGLVLLLFALGLMSKPMLVTLPLVLLLLDYWPLQRVKSQKLSQLALEKLPLLALAIASCVATFLAQSEAMSSLRSLPLPLRCANAMVACVIYLGQMIWPAGLAAFHPYSLSLLVWETAPAGTLLAVLSAVAVWQRKKQPWLLLGWLWYLLMLLPVAGVIQVGNQAHADRYTYLPQIGIYLAVTWLVAEWRMNRAALGVLMTGVLATLAVCAWDQTAYWKDSQTLWTRALACTTANDFALFNLGNAYRHQGNEEEAIAYFKKTLQINPNHARAHYNLGNSLLKKGRADEAIAHCQAALQIQPGYVEARYNLAIALMQQGRTAEAIAQYEKARQFDPVNFKIMNNLAWLLATCPEASLRDGGKAAALARQANELAGGGNLIILRTLAATLAEDGRFPEAVETAQRALRLAGAQSNNVLTGPLQAELQLYQTGRRQ